MLVNARGRFGPSIRNPAVVTADRKMRGVIDGKSVYFCMDLKINQNLEGRCEYRGFVLSHRYPETGDSDRTEWFRIVGPGESKRPKPRVSILSEFRSENVYVERPWLGWREDLREMKAISLDPASAKRTGMRRADRALVPEHADAQAVFRSPQSGTYHIGLVLRDGPVEDNAVRVEVRGKSICKCVAAGNSGALYLFVTKEPIELPKGTPIT